MNENLEMINNEMVPVWMTRGRALFVSKRSKEEKRSRKLPINVMPPTYVRIIDRYYLKQHL